ncbi:MAG: hypothetical protein K2M95_02920 [Clostridiales bacterium]|nr:hypothetical protein [Clostridiales bacterium]
MKLTFLGTAAAEGIPAVWCNCAVCQAAKKSGGRNVRTRSQILINDDLLLDFPMDTYLHVLQNKLDLSRVETVLITHAHMDHCYPQEFMLHGAPYAHDMVKPVVRIYGNEHVRQRFETALKAEISPAIAATVPFNTLHAFDTLTTESGYTITALPAKHTKGEECLIYAVTKGSKTALLFNDSGILDEATYEKAAKAGLKFDLVAFDCTYGHRQKGEGRHMGALDALGEREKMEKNKLVHKGTKYVLTHFSHNCELSHEELTVKEEPLGFIVAYDGMTIEL